MSKPHKVPGPDHPITVEPSSGRVVARVGEHVVALLRRTASTTYCPYKGDASYYSLSVDGTELTDAVWGYETPYPAVAQIAGYVAFYPDRVQVTSPR